MAAGTKSKGRKTETVLDSGDDDHADVMVQWDGDQLQLARDDSDREERHVVRLTPKQTEALRTFIGAGKPPHRQG